MANFFKSVADVIRKDPSERTVRFVVAFFGIALAGVVYAMGHPYTAMFVAVLFPTLASTPLATLEGLFEGAGKGLFALMGLGLRALFWVAIIYVAIKLAGL